MGGSIWTRDRFAADDDEHGVRFDDFVKALGVWCCLQGEPPTVASAAAAFNATNDVIREAVEAHYWMFLTGCDDAPLADRLIEYDGD